VLYFRAMRLSRSSRRRIYLTATLAILACSPSANDALAADQTILGRRLAIANPGVSTKEKVTCTASEPHSSNTLVGDPTVGGGVLEVIAHGGTPTEQSFPLPQGTNSRGKPPIHVDTGLATTRVTVRRHLGSMFDSVDFARTSDAVRAERILASIVDHAGIEIADSPEP
jgi:hypothetical protein